MNQAEAMKGKALLCEACGVEIEPTPRGRARRWCSERCRKTQYQRPCIECGAPTNLDGKRTNPNLRCRYCEATRNAEENERIRERWNEGEPAWYIAEQEGLGERTVRIRIESMRQSGLDVALHRGRNRSDWPEILRLWNAEGLTAREIGERLGQSQANVSEKLKVMREVGIDAHRRYER